MRRLISAALAVGVVLGSTGVVGASEEGVEVAGGGELRFTERAAAVVPLGPNLFWFQQVPTAGSIELEGDGLAVEASFEGLDWILVEGEGLDATSVIYAERTYTFDEIGACDAVLIGQLPGDGGGLATFHGDFTCDDGTTMDLTINDTEPILTAAGDDLLGWVFEAEGVVHRA